MNSITVIGRLGEDPQQRTAGNSTVTTFSVAETQYHNGEESTIWYRANVWGKLGENCSKYLHKGDRVTMVGSLSQREFTTRNGEARTSLEVVVNAIDYPPRQQAVQPKAKGGYNRAPQAAPMPADDDELPF